MTKWCSLKCFVYIALLTVSGTCGYSLSGWFCGGNYAEVVPAAAVGVLVDRLLLRSQWMRASVYNNICVGSQQSRS